jgi:hypothetical protein
MTFEGFEELLSEGVLTSYDKSFGDEQIWRENLIIAMFVFNGTQTTTLKEKN